MLFAQRRQLFELTSDVLPQVARPVMVRRTIEAGISDDLAGIAGERSPDDALITS